MTKRQLLGLVLLVLAALFDLATLVCGEAAVWTSGDLQENLAGSCFLAFLVGGVLTLILFQMVDSDFFKEDER